MNINRHKTIDQFSTFLILADPARNIFVWEKDLQLKLSIEKIINQEQKSSETIAFGILNQVKSNYHKILANHLTSYLQEACYWSAKKVFIEKKMNKLQCFSILIGFLFLFF